MNKDKIEELKKKFERLSPTDKIRYNLAHIEYKIDLSGISNYMIGVLIIMMFFLLPTIYSTFTRVQLIFSAIFIMIFLSIIVIIFIFKVIIRKEKELEKFLNEKSKRK